MRDCCFQLHLRGLIGRTTTPPAELVNSTAHSQIRRDEGASKVYWVVFPSSEVIGSVDGAELDLEDLEEIAEIAAPIW